MNVQGIVKEYLEENEYDGLYTHSCGCEIADLFPCGTDGCTCRPGYKTKCDCGDLCDWHISGQKCQEH